MKAERRRTPADSGPKQPVSVPAFFHLLLSSFILHPSSFCLVVCLLLTGCGGGGQPVQGSVVGPKGQPLRGVHIKFYQGTRQPVDTFADPEGHFQVSLPAGEYKVTVAPIGASAANFTPGLAGNQQGGPPVRPDNDFVIPRRYALRDHTPLSVTIPPPNGDLKLQVQDQ
jgi:hypothetical protein